MTFLDLTDVSGNGLEDGTHNVTCTAAEVKDTKAGTGQYVRAVFETENGMKLYHNFNIKNPNEMAQKIGLGQLKDFIKNSGKSEPNKLGSVDELIGLSVAVRVKTKEGEDFPVITGFKKSAKKEGSLF